MHYCYFIFLSFTLLLLIAVGMYDDETLKEYSTPSTMAMPWAVRIEMFDRNRGIGIIITNKHILTAASRLLPYKGVPNDNFKDPSLPYYDDFLTPNFW